MSGSCKSRGEKICTPNEVVATDLLIDVQLFKSGWQTALARPPSISVRSTHVPLPHPGVVSLNVEGAKPAIRSFLFSPATLPLPTATGSEGHKSSSPARSLRSGKTRIQPPAHTVKLEERIWYLLQPSLEELLTDRALSLPFLPFPYQFTGIAFLFPRYAAVLADEMGLGKTMQAIMAIRLLLHAGELRRTLLICPKPLVTNWQREFELWAPEIPLNIIAGNLEQRTWKWQLPQTLLTVANYELVQRDHELLRRAGAAYDLVLLDEAQRIKNCKGATAEAVRSIPRVRSWALTGTPIENSVEDLVGIFEFVSPGQLNSGMRPAQMARSVSDYVLRRTKDQVLTELPPKLIRDGVIDLTASQRETYRQAEEEGTVRLSRLGAKATVTHVFELILRLKQICNFDPVTCESAKSDRLIAELDEITASGKKAIVFSQYVATLEELSRRLARFGPIQYHGKVPARNRDQVIRQFREQGDKRVILMSYGVGSVGLNLQMANYVFLFDRWWNPAVEDQAINRAHRIGTAGPVTVTRFLSQMTIEERINEILEAKREIFDTIFSLSDPAPKNMGLSQQEIFGLFNLRLPKGPKIGRAHV
jgi:SNF2 family DNA or RNA helicase